MSKPSTLRIPSATGDSCIYDNPETMRREYYYSNRLVGYYTAAFLTQSSNIIPNQNKTVAFHLRPFTPGSLVGNPEKRKSVKTRGLK